MTRSPLTLAALASAAVPGLDPASVELVASEPGQQFDVAFVQDTQHRRWVVRAPVTAAAGAQMDVTAALLALLARRLPFAVPMPKGFVALKEGGRAAVYPYLPGRPLDFEQLPAGPGLAAEVGRAIAALHNVDLALYEEAGLPSYDADTYRTRRLTELDRAAATGHVPTGLLGRWERALEDVSLWRFGPRPTHGDLTGDQVLAVFADEEDAGSGKVRAVTGWEDAKVADPADDFAALVMQASPDAFDSVLEAYAHTRVERPDPFLERRARLAGELQLVSALLSAVGAGEETTVHALSDRLHWLDEDTHGEELTGRVAPAGATPLPGAVEPGPLAPVNPANLADPADLADPANTLGAPGPGRPVDAPDDPASALEAADADLDTMPIPQHPASAESGRNPDERAADARD